MHDRFYMVYDKNDRLVKITDTIPTSDKFKETRYSYKNKENTFTYELTLLIKDDEAKLYVGKSVEHISVQSVKDYYDNYYDRRLVFKFPSDKFFSTTMFVYMKRYFKETNNDYINQIDWEVSYGDLT